jgi:16S rRNA (uracil1498-N3)-methyltransferase
MYQFFIEENQLAGEKICILGSDVNHIKNVLRMKQGTRVRISVKSDIYTEERCGDAGRSFFGTIDTISDTEVWVAIEEEDVTGTELRNKIYLFQGLPKGDKMELIIQKAVELGVYEIIPVAMKNCVVKLDDKKADSKVKRWQAISESAAKQSKRTVIPEVSKPMPWKLALNKAKELDMVLIPYENARGMEATREVMRDIKPGQNIGIFIGPEGGFALDEIDAVPDNMHKISLGRRILRTETAGLATLSMLVFCLDE